MVKLNLFALDTQKIKIGVILVLCNTKYFPLFKVEHKFSMTLILLEIGIWVSNCIEVTYGPVVSSFLCTFLSVLAWIRPLLIITVRERRLRL